MLSVEPLDAAAHYRGAKEFPVARAGVSWRAVRRFDLPQRHAGRHALRLARLEARGMEEHVRLAVGGQQQATLTDRVLRVELAC
jgi:hypothetical protein